MAPNESRRPIKRSAVSDQQKRRDLALLRQEQNRQKAQEHARRLASSAVSLPADSPDMEVDVTQEVGSPSHELSVVEASKLGGREARKLFAQQFMLPEWMIDIPSQLSADWRIFARPSGKRCLVVAYKGMTTSRLRNGSILHRFPSALPNGSRSYGNFGSSQSYSILDCIFHEPDQTYYVIDLICWRGHSFLDCDTECRFFWVSSNLADTGACDLPSAHHKYRFSVVPSQECNRVGLQAAYINPVPYVKDGLLFYNRHAHYQRGVTPLVLVWKDACCSQYLLDTDSSGQVPALQQVVLELQADETLATSDDPPVVFGRLAADVIKQSGLRCGNLLRFAINDGGVKLADGKMEIADLRYIDKANRARAFADSYSKVFFQYIARHSPLRIEDLFESVTSSEDQDKNIMDVEMVG